MSCVSCQLKSFSKSLVLGQQLRKMSSVGPIEAKISAALQEALKPLHLQIVNESYMHNVPKGSESHFKVLVVSAEFREKKLIQRHRQVNAIVKEALQEVGFVHALSLETKTPEEFDKDYKLEPSPACRGGFGK